MLKAASSSLWILEQMSWFVYSCAFMSSAMFVHLNVVQFRRERDCEAIYTLENPLMRALACDITAKGHWCNRGNQNVGFRIEATIRATDFFGTSRIAQHHLAIFCIFA